MTLCFFGNRYLARGLISQLYRDPLLNKGVTGTLVRISAVVYLPTTSPERTIRGGDLTSDYASYSARRSRNDQGRDKFCRQHRDPQGRLMFTELRLEFWPEDPPNGGSCKRGIRGIHNGYDRVR